VRAVVAAELQSDDASTATAAHETLDKPGVTRAMAAGGAMTSPADLSTGQHYMQIARQWFSEGWTGNLALAADIFSGELRTNGVHVGVAGPVGRIRDRLTGFPDLTTTIEDIFVSGDKLAVTLMWRGTHTGDYGGVAATGKRVEVRDTAIWHFVDGKVSEILTLQDQFGFLRQIGYLPDSVYAA
jgi:predicted ester cyclase